MGPARELGGEARRKEDRASVVLFCICHPQLLDIAHARVCATVPAQLTAALLLLPYSGTRPDPASLLYYQLQPCPPTAIAMQVGLSRILIRNSLSEVYGGTWAAGPKGKPACLSAVRQRCDVLCCAVLSSSWTPVCYAVRTAGGLKSLWGSGGAFIQFSGEEPEGSDRTDTRMALLTGVVPVGATRLPVGCVVMAARTPAWSSMQYKKGRAMQCIRINCS